MKRTLVAIGSILSRDILYYNQLGWNVGIIADPDSMGSIIGLKEKHEGEISFVLPVNMTSQKSIRRSLKNVLLPNNTVLYNNLERYLLPRAYVADVLTLPEAQTLTIALATRATNKYLQRQVFSIHCPDVSVPFRKVTTFHQAYLFSRKYGFPVILKPAHLSQSQLVEVCEDLESLIKRFSYIFEHIQETYNINNVKRKPAVIIESFITGEQFSIDSAVDASGKFYHTPACKQYISREVSGQGFETSYSVYPSGLTTANEKRLQKAVEAAVNAIGIKSSMTHTELKITSNDEVKVIEVNMRMGGMRADLLPESYGINLLEAQTKITLGERLDQFPTTFKKYSAAPQFWAEDVGTLIRIDGVEEIMKLPSFVKDVSMLSKWEGKEVGPAQKGYPRLFHCILANESKEQFENDLQTTRSLLKVIVE
jgi:ATP-grasp domain